MRDVFLADPRTFTMGQVNAVVDYFKKEIGDRYEIFFDGDLYGIIGRCKA